MTEKKIIEQAACMGDYYLDKESQYEFVVHRKEGPERFTVDKQSVKDFVDGKLPLVEWTKIQATEKCGYITQMVDGKLVEIYVPNSKPGCLNE